MQAKSIDMHPIIIMRYSLLSQFQGTLLGAILGDFIARELSIVPLSKKESDNLGNSQEKSFQELGNNRGINRAISGEIAIISARSLIKYEGLDIEDWQENWKKWKGSKLSEYPNSGVSLKGTSELENSKLGRTSSWEWEEAKAWETAIACLPGVMLYHEVEAKLRGFLEQISEVWQGRSDLRLSNLAVGYAIALGLREKLDPHTLIPKTITILEEEGPLVEQLKEVQSLLERRSDLETATIALSNKAKAMKEELGDLGEDSREKEAIARRIASSIPISLAFYCFLSTPENWQLAVRRAGRTGRGSQICPLVGAISGAYNSSAGIPVEWRRALNSLPQKTPALMVEAVANQAEIIKLAKTLWALWCGVYNPKIMENKLNLVPAVAASNVIRPR